MLKEVIATRFIAPLREGGSLPGLVEADDFGTYVLKFTGAGQGRKTLVAEVVCGELARRLGLRMPRLVTVELDAELGLGEPDEQVQSLLRSSGGTNLGMDFLSGALGFDPLAFPVSPEEAGRVVWFDALINNVDRSWRNPNLLRWRGELWLVDHGATMIWHHNWPGVQASAARPYDASDHALASFAPDVAAAAAELAPWSPRNSSPTSPRRSRTPGSWTNPASPLRTTSGRPTRARCWHGPPTSTTASRG